MDGSNEGRQRQDLAWLGRVPITGQELAGIFCDDTPFNDQVIDEKYKCLNFIASHSSRYFATTLTCLFEI
jgi:hypothetical protein